MSSHAPGTTRLPLVATQPTARVACRTCSRRQPWAAAARRGRACERERETEHGAEREEGGNERSLVSLAHWSVFTELDAPCARQRNKALVEEVEVLERRAIRYVIYKHRNVGSLKELSGKMMEPICARRVPYLSIDRRVIEAELLHRKVRHRRWLVPLPRISTVREPRRDSALADTNASHHDNFQHH